MANREWNKVTFNAQRVFPLKVADGTRLVFSLEVVVPEQASRNAGAGWTWLNLYDAKTRLPRQGNYTLPVYVGAVDFDVMAGAAKKPPYAPGVCFTVRVGDPLQQLALFQEPIDYNMNLSAFPVPREHNEGKKQLMVAQNRQSGVGHSPSPIRQPTGLAKQQSYGHASKGAEDFAGGLGEYDESYKNAGVTLAMHYVQQRQTTQKCTVKVSARIGDK